MVYEPREDSFLLAKVVKRYAHGRVLDMGTGSGIQAHTAAEVAGVTDVVAADIDDEAIKQAKKTYPDVQFVKSDLFENISGQFDTIIFNPPHLPEAAEETDLLGKPDLALSGGKEGYELILTFLEQAKDYLTASGIILLLFSSFSGKAIIDKKLQELGFKKEPIATEKLFSEQLFVYKIS